MLVFRYHNAGKKIQLWLVEKNHILPLKKSIDLYINILAILAIFEWRVGGVFYWTRQSNGLSALFVTIWRFYLESLIFCLWLCRYRYMPSISMFLHQESLDRNPQRTILFSALNINITVPGCIPAEEMKFVLQHLPGKIAYKVGT